MVGPPANDPGTTFRAAAKTDERDRAAQLAYQEVQAKRVEIGLLIETAPLDAVDLASPGRPTPLFVARPASHNITSLRAGGSSMSQTQPRTLSLIGVTP